MIAGLLHLGACIAYLIAWCALVAVARRMFPRSAIVERTAIATLALLRSIDIVLCTAWIAPLFVVGLASRPSGRQMISSYVGMAAFNGHRWAARVAAVIDWLAASLGDRPAHCHRAFLAYRGLDGAANRGA